MQGNNKITIFDYYMRIKKDCFFFVEGQIRKLLNFYQVS